MHNRNADVTGFFDLNYIAVQYILFNFSLIFKYFRFFHRTNRCREIAKRNTVPLEDTDFIVHIGIVNDILKEESRRALLATISALGEPDREILFRRYYYDQKPKEIALALDMSTKQVNNRLYQTKLKLREALSH